MSNTKNNNLCPKIACNNICENYGNKPNKTY